MRLQVGVLKPIDLSFQSTKPDELIASPFFFIKAVVDQFSRPLWRKDGYVDVPTGSQRLLRGRFPNKLSK
jgi:hypothetical protein